MNQATLYVGGKPIGSVDSLDIGIKRDAPKQPTTPMFHGGSFSISNAKFSHLSSLFGITLVADPRLSNSVQARTHRKRRINKKWAKRYGYIQVPINKAYQDGNTVYAHPTVIEYLKRMGW